MRSVSRPVSHGKVLGLEAVDLVLSRVEHLEGLLPCLVAAVIDGADLVAGQRQRRVRHYVLHQQAATLGWATSNISTICLMMKAQWIIFYDDPMHD